MEESIAIRPNPLQIGDKAMTLRPDAHDQESPDRADPQTAGAGDSEAVEFEGLVERCMGNLAFVERVLGKFQERFPQQVAELEGLLETKDAERLATVAHRMKGNSANVSATGLQQIAAEIEDLCREGRVGEVAPHVDRLRHEWARYLDCSARLLSAAGVP